MIDDKQKLYHALESMKQIKHRVHEKGIAFFFDYDGTLTPIVDKPELAVLSDEMRECLKQISEHYFVAIISGRALSDVRQLVAIDTIYYVGNHGLEVTGPHLNELELDIHPELINLINSIALKLKSRLSEIKGVIIENKKFSLSVHYRLVNNKYISQIEKTVDNIVKNNSSLDKHLGKKVFEIRPKTAWNKGKIVLHLLQQLNLSLDNVVPLYLGDDITDEDAFQALQKKGIGILVSHEYRKSAANYYLLDPHEVLLFLKQFRA